MQQPLYPDIEPFHHFWLATGSQHKVYVEQSGNPNGIPVLFLHGGPCSGTKPKHRCFFNPDIYHIILFDQRGCGLSEPFGELVANTTQDLIDDMERIRQQLQIKKWVLFSGSWGSTLAILYAQQHQKKVAAMIIRGVFLAREKDLSWFVKEGVNAIYPEAYQNLLESLDQHKIDNLYATLWGDDELAVRRMTKAWMQWSGQVALGTHYRKDESLEHISNKMVEQVKMELHYAKNKYFIAENQVLKACAALQGIPTIIIHGRYDLVCPMEAGASLAKALSNAEFVILPTAGHVAQGKEMIDALVNASDKIAEDLRRLL
jgi:proline iminopeptidase